MQTFHSWLSGLGAIVAAYLILTNPCFAGGSIGWPQVHDQLVKEDPFLAAFLDKTLEMSPSGGGLRVGHDKDGNSLVPGVGVGTRIPPFDFLAKPAGATGGYTLHITLEPVYFDTDKSTLWEMHLRMRRASE